MNRRDFLRKTAVAALMATPAMQAAAFLRDFGLPPNLKETFFVDIAAGPDMAKMVTIYWELGKGGTIVAVTDIPEEAGPGDTIHLARLPAKAKVLGVQRHDDLKWMEFTTS